MAAAELYKAQASADFPFPPPLPPVRINRPSAVIIRAEGRREAVIFGLEQGGVKLPTSKPIAAEGAGDRFEITNQCRIGTSTANCRFLAHFI